MQHVCGSCYGDLSEYDRVCSVVDAVFTSETIENKAKAVQPEMPFEYATMDKNVTETGENDKPDPLQQVCGTESRTVEAQALAVEFTEQALKETGDDDDELDVLKAALWLAAERVVGLRKELADREAQLAVYDKIVPDAARIAETTAKLARVEELPAKWNRKSFAARQTGTLTPTGVAACDAQDECHDQLVDALQSAT